MKKKFVKNHGGTLNKPWEENYHKLIEYEGLFEEYLEMGKYCRKQESSELTCRLLFLLFYLI